MASNLLGMASNLVAMASNLSEYVFPYVCVHFSSSLFCSPVLRLLFSPCLRVLFLPYLTIDHKCVQWYTQDGCSQPSELHSTSCDIVNQSPVTCTGAGTWLRL